MCAQLQGIAGTREVQPAKLPLHQTLNVLRTPERLTEGGGEIRAQILEILDSHG